MGPCNPTGAALLAATLALIALAFGGGTWFVKQRAERRSEAVRHVVELRNDVGAAVTQAVELRGQFHFRQAREPPATEMTSPERPGTTEAGSAPSKG